MKQQLLNPGFNLGFLIPFLLTISITRSLPLKRNSNLNIVQWSCKSQFLLDLLHIKQEIKGLKLIAFIIKSFQTNISL